MPSAAQARSVQRRVATIQRSSARPASRAPIAKAQGTARPDVAEVQHRRVADHVRVLQARVEPEPVRRRRDRRERARDRGQQPRERENETAQHGRHPEHEVGCPAPVDPDGKRRVRGQDEQPEEQRPFLPAPEGGELVGRRQRLARVLLDVAEREVVAEEAGGEDDRGHERREEGRDEGVTRRSRRAGAGGSTLRRRRRGARTPPGRE